jgi:hypothetical protein
VGGENTFFIDDQSIIDNAIPSKSHISGYSNLIRNSDQNVFVLGSQNTLIKSPHTIVLGNDNEVESTGLPQTSILIGSLNKVDHVGGRVNNILIGSDNISYFDRTIAIGQSQEPSANSIYIGRNNNNGGHINTNRNVVMGDRINFTNNVVDSSIYIGHHFDVSAIDGGTAAFSTKKNIGIGNNIYPLNSASPESRIGAISIGNEITLRMSSINIGNNITTGNTNASLPTGHSINIGNNIQNTRRMQFSDVIHGSSASNRIGGSIFIGSVDTTKLPRQVFDNDLFPGTTNPATIALAIAPNMAHNHKAPFTLLAMDEYANLFIGLRDSDPTSTGSYINATEGPNTMGGSRVYARQFCAIVGSIGSLTVSDSRMKSNIKVLSGDYRSYLSKLDPFSYYYTDDKHQRTDWGFMAQDVQRYFPHLIDDIGDGVLAIGYTGFIPILWKINQDQQTELDAQQKRIVELERQIKFINEFNADELRRHENRIAELEKQLQTVLEKLEK